MQQTKFMNNGARSIISVLVSFCMKHSLEPVYPPSDIMVLEYMLIEHSAPAVQVMLQTKMKNTRTITIKHASLKYWISLLQNMLKSNVSAKRTDPYIVDWLPVQESIREEIYDMLCNGFLITDYGYQQMCSMQKISNSYKPYDVEKACNSARSNNVYDLSYVLAILEKKSAMDDIDMMKRKRLDDKIKKSNELLTPKAHTHNIMDIAVIADSWQQMIENAELEKKLKEVMK